jgi:hypothetical protein
MRAKTTPQDYIRARVMIDEEGHWLWQRYIHPNGYGCIGLKTYRSQWAHRVSYEVFVGPIPQGLTIDHLCRIQRCVNPDHLEAVTQRENTLRAPTALATINAAKTRCLRGHEFTASNTKPVGAGARRACRMCLAMHQRAYKQRKILAGTWVSR